MKTTEKHVASLLALLIPALFVGCKSKPIEVLPSLAETPDASNPFVGVWEGGGFYNTRRIYIFTDKNQWESYNPSKRGTYAIKGSNLFMTERFFISIWFGIPPREFTTIARLDGDIMKIGTTTLHRVSADWQRYEVNQGTTTK